MAVSRHLIRPVDGDRGQPDRRPGRDDGHRPQPSTRRHRLVGVPPEQLGPGHTPGGADRQQRHEREPLTAPPAAVDAPLQHLDGVPAGQEPGHRPRPRRQLVQRHADAADDDDRQEHRLPQRLHGRHGVGQRGDHQPEPLQGERHREERDGQLQRVGRQRRAEDEPGDADLQHGRAGDDHEPGDHRADDQPGRRGRQQAVASPHAPLAVGDQPGRHAEAGPAQHADREQLAHLGREPGRLPEQRGEGEQEQHRDQVAVGQRQPVAAVQPQGEQRVLHQARRSCGPPGEVEEGVLQ